MLPNKLFHYTSIETLALILKYKKFRFTRLSLLNDPLEGKSNDLAKTEELAYCSSWSANPVDTIPMWKMYTDLQGVRLSVNTTDIFSNGKEPEFQNLGTQISPVTLLDKPLEVRNRNGNKIPLPIERLFGPEQVQYLDGQEALNVKVTQSITDCTSGKPITRTWLKLDGIGLKKDICWEYEREWRFRITSFESTIPKNIPLDNFIEHFNLENDSIDIPISESFFGSLDIVLGPKCHEGHRAIVESLLKSNSIDAMISMSTIKIK